MDPLGDVGTFGPSRCGKGNAFFQPLIKHNLTGELVDRWRGFNAMFRPVWLEVLSIAT